VGSSDRDELVLGLLAAPGWPTEVAEALAEDLPGLLADRVSDAVAWRVPVRTDPAVADTGHGVEAIDFARARLLRDGWDIAVCITDAPVRIGRRPVVADASATHGVALISLPALGAVQTRRRARDAVIRLVDGLVGESLELGERGPRRRARVSHRIASLAAPIRAVEPPDDDLDLRFVAAVVRGNVRLLAGLVRANRPWRLIARLSRALAAAAAAVVFALVTSDLWVLADALDWLRLLVLTVVSIGATVIWLIFSHRLWEAASGDADRLAPGHEHRVGCVASGAGRGLPVLLVAHVIAPGDRAAGLVVLLHGDVEHEAVGRGAMPVVLARLEEDAIAGADDLDRSALALAQADALGDEDRLAMGMEVPGGACAGREVHGGSAEC
jgi:hypothetical protein